MGLQIPAFVPSDFLTVAGYKAVLPGSGPRETRYFSSYMSVFSILSRHLSLLVLWPDTPSHCNGLTSSFLTLITHRGIWGFLCNVSLGDSVWTCMSVHTDVHALPHVTSLALLTTGGPWSLPISLQFRLTGWNLFLHRLDVCNRSAYMYSSYLVSLKNIW